MKRILQIASITLLTIFFLGLFLWKSNLSDVWRIMKATDPLWFALGLLINGMALVIRTQRWRILIGGDEPRPAFYPTFFATASGYMLSTVLPIRAGDVARPALLARRTPVRFSVALGTVLTERMLDLVSILTLFVFFCVRHWGDFPRHEGFIRSAAIGTGTLLGAVIVFLFALRFFSPVVRRLHAFVGRIVPKRFREEWMRFFDSFASTLRITERPRDFIAVVFCTAAIWFCLCAQFSVVLVAAHRQLPLDSSLFINGVATAGIAIPTPGGVGGFHKVCQWVLTSFYNFDIDSSVALAVLFHIVGTLPVVVVGAVLFLREGVRLRDVRRQADDAM